MNRQQRRAQLARERDERMLALQGTFGEGLIERPRLLSQRLEVALGAEAPRTSLRSAAWQSAMRKLWAMEREAWNRHPQHERELAEVVQSMRNAEAKTEKK